MKTSYWATALLAAVLLPIEAQACSLAPGYFHQVTALRGRVVGRNLGPLLRWPRQSFAVSDATLTLYEYSTPANVSDLKRISVPQSDSHGNFDFGKIGIEHYFLNIDAKGPHARNDLFDVEVTDRVKLTERVLIDISPIHPDCKGGHEFIEKK